MYNYIKTPNLTEEKISLCVLQNETEIVNALQKLGIKTLTTQKDKNLSDEVSCHTDMLLCHLGENKILLAGSQKVLYNELTDLGFEVSFANELQKEYPKDIILNAAIGKDFVLGNLKYISPDILSAHEKVLHINVKQGYAKCSLCFVNENAFITEDISIKNALEKTGKDVLLISKGDILLSKEHYGFFGGATGKISKHELAICGNLSYHADGDKINDFLKNHGVVPVELSYSQIKDIGGIIPLMY